MANQILIFDDDEDILSICSYILEDEGYQVKTFINSDDVVNRVTALNPALIFMDNWIPGGGGVGAVQQIKSDPNLSHIPVIYFSAHLDIEELSVKANADAFLAKPFDLNKLVNLVKAYVSN
ncbi:response regulator [Mucilaginibacter ginkgonis]|uniref:Response regulator n=1 Tax=Mucilaginibacter ginkgonis TaxID=2682091 RepID=A0A6I4IMP4_9SPHI|nr:response regulator [Mucilaginibacter ginkgonis]